MKAAGREVVFRWRADRPDLRLRVRGLGLRSASFAEFTFRAWPGASDDELLTFAYDVANLCTFAAGQLTGAPFVTFKETEDRVVRRILRQPVTSSFRDSAVVPMPFEFKRFFESCFEEFVRLRGSRADWSKLTSYVGSMDQCQFLEQKFATAMIGVEFLARQCLFDVMGVPIEQLEKLTFPALMGSARKRLSWDVPKHYKINEVARVLRNAVAHGGQLPTRGNEEFRHLYDKWRLFFLRRVLIRLGYNGKVLSPHNGWESMSDVNDFSEEQNSFVVAPEMLAQFQGLAARLRKLGGPGAAEITT